MRELQRDLDRAYAKQQRLGDKLSNADSQLKAANERGHARAAERLKKDVDYLTSEYRQINSDIDAIREAMLHTRG